MILTMVGRQPILLPWRFPGCQVPALTTHTSDYPLPVNPTPTDLHTGTSTESPPIHNSPPTNTSSTVPTPSIHLTLKESAVTPAHNLVTPLPHRFNKLISWQYGKICSAPPGNRNRSSVVGPQRHNHHATN